MPTILKTADAKITLKADDSEAGTFDALVAVFGNVDLQGDVIDPGAFTETLAAYKSAGVPIPILWSHDWEDPASHIGYADAAKAEETADGLLLKSVTLDIADNDRAAQVYRLLKGGRVTQFSFAATTPDEAGAWSLEEADDGRIVTHLRKLDLIEAGPCLKGANPETRLVGVKSMTPMLSTGEAAPDVRAKAGRKLAQKHVDVLTSVVDRLKSAATDATTLLEAVAGDIEPQTPEADPASVIDPAAASEDTKAERKSAAATILAGFAGR